MATDKTTREATPPQPAEEPDVAGHGWRLAEPEIDREPEVEGHAAKWGAEQDLLAQLAQADRDRQARSAVGTGRDGGMLDKIRRFARREE